MKKYTNTRHLRVYAPAAYGSDETEHVAEIEGTMVDFTEGPLTGIVAQVVRHNDGYAVTFVDRSYALIEHSIDADGEERCYVRPFRADYVEGQFVPQEIPGMCSLPPKDKLAAAVVACEAFTAADLAIFAVEGE